MANDFGLSEALKQIYEPAIRARLQREMTLLEMLDTRTPAEKEAAAKKWQWRKDHVCLNESPSFNDDTFECEREKGHEGDHMVVLEESSGLTVTWRNDG